MQFVVVATSKICIHDFVARYYRAPCLRRCDIGITIATRTQPSSLKDEMQSIAPRRNGYQLQMPKKLERSPLQ